MTADDTPSTPFQYESEQPPSLTVVEALARLEGVDPTALRYTLYDYIDPHARDTDTEIPTLLSEAVSNEDLVAFDDRYWVMRTGKYRLNRYDLPET